MTELGTLKPFTNVAINKVTFLSLRPVRNLSFSPEGFPTSGNDIDVALVIDVLVACSLRLPVSP